jgi:hypothetical protein
MAIEKSLYQVPQGMAATMGAEPDITVEVEDPTMVMEVEMEEEISTGTGSEEFNANLADEMDESELQSLAEDLEEDIGNDIESRKDWEKMYKDGMKSVPSHGTAPAVFTTQ